MKRFLPVLVLGAAMASILFAQDFAFNKLAAPVGVVGPTQINVAEFDSASLTANQAATPVYTVPASAQGTYEMACAGSVTTTAAVFQLPSFQTSFTDADTNIAATLTQGSNVSNLRFAGVVHIFNAHASSVIQIGTTSYLSIPASTMVYKIHCKLYFLGV